MPRLAGARLLLFTAVVALGLDAADGKHKKFRRRELADGASADSAAPLPLSPTHDVRCGGRACRPGEGNLKGYQHWSQPYKHVPVKLADTYGSPPGWRRRSDPFPSHRYASLVEVAKSRLRDNFVLLCAADFDFRLLALNWYRAAAKVGVENHLVHSLDGDVLSFLRGRGVATSNGTAGLNAWVDPTSRLRRHIQRALAERHMAAAALVKEGISVLLADSSAVVLKPVAPFFIDTMSRGTPPEIMAMRGGCGPNRKLGCDLLWNFLFLRGAGPGDSRVLEYIHGAISKGLIDFYLRWWSGHHCIDSNGYTKALKDSGKPRLEGGLTAEANALEPQKTAIVTLRGAGGLRLAMLPSNLFPNAGSFTGGRATRAEALVGRVVRPDQDPARSHRLRLDRYDEVDFEQMRAAMVSAGLWVLLPSDEAI